MLAVLKYSSPWVLIMNNLHLQQPFSQSGIGKLMVEWLEW